MGRLNSAMSDSSARAAAAEDAPAKNTRRSRAEAAGADGSSDGKSPTSKGSPRGSGVKQRKKSGNSPKNSPKLSGKGDGPLTAAVGKKDETKGVSKWQKMAKHTIVAFAFIGIMISIVLSDHIIIVLVVALFQTMVFAELVAVRQDVRVENRKIPLFRSLNWYGYVVAMFFTYGKDFGSYFGW